MTLNFICKDVNFKDNAQIAVFEKSNKTSNLKPTEVVGKLEISSGGISIIINDQDKFNTYAIGEEYNFDIKPNNSKTK